MKKYLLIFLMTGVLACTSSAGTITAFVSYGIFSTPAKGPYVETYLSFLGNTIRFVKNSSGKYQGTVDISIAFTQNNEIRSAEKYSLSSPEIADTIGGFPNFIDQQRFPLVAGSYEMEMTISDKNRPSDKPVTSKIPVLIDFKEGIVGISSVQLLESYTKATTPGILTKSGYDLTPYVSAYYPANIDRIRFYAEMYNAKKIIGEGEKILVSYYLESFDSKTRLNDYSGFNKQVANDVNILMTEFNIAALPTGNYNLVVELRDKDNKIQAQQKTFIQRTNKPAALSFDDIRSISVATTWVSVYRNADSLAYYIRSIRPISDHSEVMFAENQLKGKNLELMQQYFYNFWKSRNPTQPEIAWLDYYEEVKKVNREFGTYGLKGFDSDRGRVYLQYGPPDYRSKYDTEPSALPYEIWEYNRLVDKSQFLSNPDNMQSTKKFVFYNPDLVTNKWPLIHSDARGEIYNERWKLLVHKRDVQSNNLDDVDVPDHFGGNLDDNYNNPK
jgi:GWxTD domain-containing protein